MPSPVVRSDRLAGRDNGPGLAGFTLWGGSADRPRPPTDHRRAARRVRKARAARLLARGDVPEADRAVAAGAGQQIPSGAKATDSTSPSRPDSSACGVVRIWCRSVRQRSRTSADFRLGHQTAEHRLDRSGPSARISRDAASRTAYESSSSRASNASRRRRCVLVALPEHRRDQLDPPPGPADDQQVLRRGIGETIHAAAALQPPARLAGLGVPQPHRPVPAAGDHAPAVRREEAGVDERNRRAAGRAAPGPCPRPRRGRHRPRPRAAACHRARTPPRRCGLDGRAACAPRPHAPRPTA